MITPSRTGNTRIPAPERSAEPWHLGAAIILGFPVSASLSTLELWDPSSTLWGLAGDAVSIAIVGLAVFAILVSARVPRQRVTGLLLAVMFFYGSLFLSAIAGASGGALPPPVYFASAAVVLAFLLSGTYSSAWLTRTASNAIRITLVISLLSTIAMPDLAFNTVEARNIAGIPRLAGIAGHPNSLAIQAALGLFLEFHRGSRWWWKAFAFLIVALAQSTTVFNVVALGLLILGAYRSRTALAAIWAGAVVSVALILLAPQSSTEFVASILPENADTFTGRTRIWSAALDSFVNNPLLGYGPGLFDEAYRAMYGLSPVATHAFSQYIQTLAGQGIVGILALTTLGLVMVVYALRNSSRTAGVSLSLVGLLLIRFVTETPLRPSVIGYSLLMVAVIIGLLGAWESERYAGPAPVLVHRRTAVHSSSRRASSRGAPTAHPSA